MASIFWRVDNSPNSYYIESMNFRQLYNQISNETNSIYHVLCQKIGMADSDLLILYVLCESENSVTQKDLVHFTGLPKQTVNSCIRKFELQEILKLENLDGKSKSVVLTKKGQKFVKEKVLPVTDLEDKIFSSWTKSELQIFIGLCERYKNQLAEEVASYEK